ncbi:MAG: hypothetical protein H6Q52_819, partial [Deltaproteobacteria bacterium]|nr:hypothetical protein [Deltaproteobacteria bacterium]
MYGLPNRDKEIIFFYDNRRTKNGFPVRRSGIQGKNDTSGISRVRVRED